VFHRRIRLAEACRCVPALLELLSQSGGGWGSGRRPAVLLLPQLRILTRPRNTPRPWVPALAAAGVCLACRAGDRHRRGACRKRFLRLHRVPPAEPCLVNANPSCIEPLGLYEGLAAAGRCLAEPVVDVAPGIGSPAPWPRCCVALHGRSQRAPQRIADDDPPFQAGPCADQGVPSFGQAGGAGPATFEWPRCGCATWLRCWAIGHLTSHGMTSSPKRRHLPVVVDDTLLYSHRDAGILGFRHDGQAAQLPGILS